MKSLRQSWSIAFGFFALLAAGLFSAAAAQQAAPQGDADSGRALYETTGCYQCHGWAGQGGGAGPRLNPPLPFEPFVLQLRQPRDVMIPYSETVLSEQQAADIYAFVRTFPPPPDPASIPILQ